MAAKGSVAPLTPSTGSSHQRHIFLFGDLTQPFEDDFRQLLHCKSNALLQSFFEQVSLAYRHQIASLSAEEQEWFPRFTNLVDLAAGVDGTIGAPALRFSLLCVYQIGRFINHNVYPNAADLYVVGVCTGSFAAAAIASSRTMVELIPAAIEAALAALRTGLHSLRMQRDIELAPADGARSWSYIISMSESKALQIIHEFCKNRPLSHCSRPYVSAVAPSTVTISGPPQVLKNLIDSFALKAHPTSIHSPYHASHLFGPEDVEEVFGRLQDEKLKQSRSHLTFLSASSGTSMEAGDFPELLRQAIQEALCEQVRWDKIGPALATSLAQTATSMSCLVLPVASNATTLLCSALRQEATLSVSVSDVLNTSVKGPQITPTSGKYQGSKIAIVGYSGRFPEAASNDELWEVLKAARDCHRTIPEDRFDWEAHYDASGKKKNTSRVKFGCFINEPGVFDARFFNISPREAENADPAQRLALMAAYEAMEMGGFVPDRTPSTQRDRVGVFFGTTSDDWREVNSGQDVDTYFIPGGNRAFVPGRISYFFRFSGPSISVDTACSSSFAAISTACHYLWRGECDTAISGGTNVLTNPDNFVGLDRGHFLSTTGNCNPFDNAADGYCRADAVGTVILKRLEDALLDGDPIFGVIAGSSTNHCGQTVSITRPHEGDQLSLFKRILRQTNTDPTDVSYVEMHGTGTQAGDAAEMSSVLSAFAWDRRRSKVTPSRPLHLGAIKANVGHSESGSGVTALIKVLMMMRHSEIPPHRLNGQLNRHFPADMTDRNVHIAFKTKPWRREDCPNNKRVSFLNNFSAAGGNTAILLEDAPLRSTSEIVQSNARSLVPVTVSAKSIEALKSNIRGLISYLDSNPGVSLSALSYTTTARRIHHKFRIVVSGNSLATITSALKRFLDDNAKFKAVKPEPPNMGFAFTGQGILYAGIGRQLYEQVPSFHADILRFDRLAQRQGFPSFLPMVTGEHHVNAQNTDPVLAQLGLSCVQMAISNLWTIWAGKPACVIGHSLGEYAALYTAGVLSASDAIYLVGRRAQLLSQYCTKSTHSMLTIKAPLVAVKPELAGTSCTVACINSPTNVTVSGPREAIEQLSATLKPKGFEGVLLDVPYAFHSAQVETILKEFESLAGTVQFHQPTISYLSPLLSKSINEAGVLNASYVARAARACVDFKGAIDAACQAKLVDDSTIWIEIGAHPACSGMIKQIIGSQAITAPSLRKDIDTWKVLMGSIETIYQQGANVHWEQFHRGFEPSYEVLHLPSYKWDLKNYWIQYRHNFCLTKGDDPATLATATSPKSLPSPALSSSVHRVVEESNSAGTSTVLTESDIHDPRLAPILSGHSVNTAMLCPSSLYADMALTITKYMMKSNGLFNDDVGLDCGGMSVQRPLISQSSSTSQLLRVSAKADWAKQEVLLSFFSVDAKARKLADHASCIVKIGERQSWLDDWKHHAYLITSRISSLHQAVDSGAAHKLKRGLAYKLFSSLVDYAPAYQGMEQVVLDSDCLEATAEVKFQVDDQGFDWNPCWIDSLGHIAGFIMNGNDNIYSKDQVFINHGWRRMRCGKPVQSGKSYTTYNRMQLESGTMYSGNTYIFDGQELIAVFEGVKFQGVDRSVLDQLLPSKARPAPAKIAPKVAPPQAPPVTQSNESKVNEASEAAKVSSAPAPAGKISEALKIIAEEVQVEELGLDTELSDLGVDSLLSLTIASRLREELEVEMPSSALVEHPTIRSLANSIGLDTGTAVDSRQPQAVQSGTSTPSDDSTDEDQKSTSSEATELDDDINIPDSHEKNIKPTIVRESSMAVQSLSSGWPLTERSLDSLLEPAMIHTLSEELDDRIPSPMFADDKISGDIDVDIAEVDSMSNSDETVDGDEAPDEGIEGKRAYKKLFAEPINIIDITDPPHATSVLLQGSSKTATEILFFFPDGAGSASSYYALPDISPNVAVYALNCPWLKTPQNLKCSLEEYVAKFLIEVRRRQPSGPYNFSGVSAGGILAYEAARQLERVGESVGKLILLDSPDPVGLENPNDRLYDFLDSMGMFGISGKETPKWLRPHFDAFLKVLDDYDVERFAGSSPPDTHIIYARDGMCKDENGPRPEIRDDDPREMRWLLENRTDFSGAGWNTLLGKENLKISVLDDVNHYTILRPGPKIKELSTLVARALEV